MKRKLSVLVSVLICLVTVFSVASYAEWTNGTDGKSYLRNGAKTTGLMLIDGIRYKFDDNGNLLGEYNGWSQSRSTGDYYYYINGIAQTDFWYNRGNVWSYFDADGKMAVGEKNIDGYNYTFYANGTWDGSIPIDKKEIHENLLREIPEIYGGLNTGYSSPLTVYTTDMDKAMETVKILYPNLPFFYFVKCENTFKSQKAVYDELNAYKNKYAKITVNSYSYENTGTFFGDYGMYYYAEVQRGIVGFDYYDSYYTALNFAESVYEKHGIVGMAEDVIYDEPDYGYDVAAAEITEDGIDYAYFYEFYNQNKPYVYNYDLTYSDNEVYEEEAVEDVDVAPVPRLDIFTVNPYTGDEPADVYRDPLRDLYYKSDICSRVFAYGNSYNLYVKKIDGYIDEVVDFYIKKGYSVIKENNKLLLGFKSYNETKTAVINFIKADYSIEEMAQAVSSLRGITYSHRVYIDNSCLSYYEDDYKTSGGKVRLYCYKNYEKVKEIAGKVNNQNVIELIKRY